MSDGEGATDNRPTLEDLCGPNWAQKLRRRVLAILGHAADDAGDGRFGIYTYVFPLGQVKFTVTATTTGAGEPTTLTIGHSYRGGFISPLVHDTLGAIIESESIQVSGVEENRFGELTFNLD